MSTTIQKPAPIAGPMPRMPKLIGHNAEAEAEFIRTYVSPYFLPKRVTAARKRGAQKVTVPLEALETLIARVEAARNKGQGSMSVGVDTLASLLQEVGIAA